jgi:glycerate kinase
MPHRILVAPDKFKGSLTAPAAAQAIGDGIRDALPDAEIVLRPIADGGDGTAETLHAALGGSWVHVPGVADPLGRPIEARYLWIGADLAVIAMSEASGLWRLHPGEYDPLRASTFGTGQLIADALHRGARSILIGLGGSATNDGGAGMARALGFQFLDSFGRPLDLPAALADLGTIAPPSHAAAAEITGLCEVSNPLLGPHGASRTFAPQKGATPALAESLDRHLRHLANVVARDLHCDFRDTPGAGAAGGLGFGLLSFCSASLKPGFETIAALLGLQREIATCDLVITGEGSLDDQTLHGKVPAASRTSPEPRQTRTCLCRAHRRLTRVVGGVRRPHAITPAGMPVDAAFAEASTLLRQSVAHALARRRHTKRVARFSFLPPRCV